MNQPPILFGRRRIAQRSASLTQGATGQTYQAAQTAQQHTNYAQQVQPLDSPFGGFTLPGFLGGPSADPSTHPPADIPVPTSIPSVGGSADFLQGHTYIAGIQVSPFIPQAMIQSTIAQIPGFSDPQVFGIIGGQAGPYTLPSNVPDGANYVVSAKRTGADVKGQPYPANIIWILDAGSLGSGGSGISPVPPGPGGTPPTPGASASAGKILGLEPTTLLLLGLAGIVGVVLLTSKHDEHTRVRASNPGRRRRIRR